jgi:hypothetical protein
MNINHLFLRSQYPPPADTSILMDIFTDFLTDLHSPGSVAVRPPDGDKYIRRVELANNILMNSSKVARALHRRSENPIPFDRSDRLWNKKRHEITETDRF